MQRHLKALEERGLIEKVTDREKTYLDLSGLKKKLEELTPRHAWKHKLKPYDGFLDIGQDDGLQNRRTDG